MQLTIDSNEPLKNVLEVVGSIYGVELAVVSDTGQGPSNSSAKGDGQRETRPSTRRSTAKSSATPTRSGKRSATKSSKTDLSDVRAWARASGRQVSDRGRVSNALLAEYHESTGR